MDFFKKSNVRECTNLDYADTRIYHSKDRKNEGNMLRRLARRRLKQELLKEIVLSEKDVL